MNADRFKELVSSLENCRELEQLENKLARFNIFEILNIEYRELCHSDLLACLFDPHQNHGLQAFFLKAWLKEVFRASDSPNASNQLPLEINKYSFESVQVLREWNFVDLLVIVGDSDDKTLVVAIENKVLSIQHSNQLARSREKVTKAFPRAHHAFVLLSVNGEIPDDHSFRVATYKQVLNALEFCLKERSGAMGKEPRCVIEQYIEIIRSHLMPNSESDPEIERLAKSIYAAHRQALDTILRYRPDNPLRAAVVNNIRDDGVFRVLNPNAKDPIYLLPGSWDVSKNKGGNFVYLELEFGRKAVLKGRTGKGVDASWEPLRQRAINRVRELDWPNTVGDETGRWPLYCRVEGPAVSLDVIDTEAIREEASKVVSWLNEERSDPGFTRMQEIFTEELRKYPGDGSGSVLPGE